MSRRIGNAALLLVALVAGGARAADDIQVHASTDADEVAVDGTLNLQILVTVASGSQGADVQLPDFKDFDLVGRSQSEQTTIEFSNGAQSIHRRIVTNVALTPKHEGSATIEPARVTYRGRSYQTQPITVRVLGAAQAQRRRGAQPSARDTEEDPFRGMGSQIGTRDLLLRATIDNDAPYVGQQVTYSLYLLARGGVSGIDKLQVPKFDGFWSEALEEPQQLINEPRIIDGIPYSSFLLRKRALFPLRPGKVEIDPAEVDVLSGFGMLFSRSSAHRVAQAITIDVQPLPTAGRPTAFDLGNVGNWTLSTAVEPLTVSVGQPVTFKLVAQGRGNVRDLRLPRLGQVPGLRAYDATTTDKKSVEKGQLMGTRTIEQLLVPERTGDLEIPSLSMDIFDPAQKAYRTIRTEPVRLLVHAAEPGTAATVAQPAQNLLAAGGLRPIRLRLRAAAIGAPPWGQVWFWPALAAGPFAVAILVASGRARRMFWKDPRELRMRRARTAAQARLRGAEAMLAEKRPGPEFYAEVARGLTGYLADKQGIVAAGLTREELASALLARGHPSATVRALLGVLDHCDERRFAPGAPDERAQRTLLADADRILGELDRPGKDAA
ncbi:MAG: protein BatD [Deltaproteobacteria bacterium]|nr:MAG: protein BatD [Deltaproteobacteria bacterium]